MSILRNPFLSLKQTNRNICFDLLKLFAMLLVVMDHCLQRWIPYAMNSQLYNFIFLTQMPLFMFVAGYFASKSIGKTDSFLDIWKRWTSYALSLLIPFITYAIIKTFIYGDNGYNPLVSIYKSIVNPQQSLWFLWALFWMQSFLLAAKCIVLLFEKKITKKICKDIMTIVIYIMFLIIPITIYLFGNGIFDSKLIVYYSLFFVFGQCFYYIKPLIDNKSSNQKKLISIIAFSISLIGLIMTMILRPTIIFDSESILNMALRIFGSLCSIILLYFIADAISNFSIVKVCSRLGALSLEFYVVHRILLLIPLLNEPIQYEQIGNAFAFIGLYLMVCVLTSLLIFILKTNLITDFVFFGKHKK